MFVRFAMLVYYVMIWLVFRGFRRFGGLLGILLVWFYVVCVGWLFCCRVCGFCCSFVLLLCLIGCLGVIVYFVCCIYLFGLVFWVYYFVCLVVCLVFIVYFFLGFDLIALIMWFDVAFVCLV